MMNDVENEVEEQQAEDGSVNRVPELKQLSDDIDKATNTLSDTTLELESAIQQYQSAEAKLDGAVTTISKKVDTINQHIDKVLESSPTKIKVSVNVNDADWQKIQGMFDKERQWMTSQMQIYTREVNSMFANERKKYVNATRNMTGVTSVIMPSVFWGSSLRMASLWLQEESV